METKLEVREHLMKFEVQIIQPSSKQLFWICACCKQIIPKLSESLKWHTDSPEHTNPLINE